MARILSAWSPSWAIANWRRRNPSAWPADAPFALIAAERGVRKLSAVDARAAALGHWAGQKATDAMALTPELATADAEPDKDAAALAALADWCVRFSPAVAPDPPDGLFLDITGVDHLWGGEAAMLADLTARLGANGIPARCAIADTPGAAWALARFAEAGTIAPPQGQAALLAPLPVGALRLEPQTAAQITRLGLATVGRLAGLPRDQVTRRFGPQAVLRLDQAMGRVGEALSFRRPPSPWFARLAFAEPISAPEDLARVSGDIARALCAQLEARGHAARRFELAFHRLDGRAERLSIGLSLPGRAPGPIARLFAPLLETVDPGFGIEVATLTATEAEPAGARQKTLGEKEAEAEAGVAPLVDRLANRLGEDRVWRPEPYPSHTPERAVTRRPPLSPPDRDVAGWDPARPRPLRLFRKPEPLDGVMAPVPDDPPVMFRWRGRLHRVSRAEGPERLAEEWWRRADFEEASPAHVRDYYRVEDEAGGRFWIFRAGLYAAGEPARWWLHGLFG